MKRSDVLSSGNCTTCKYFTGRGRLIGHGGGYVTVGYSALYLFRYFLVRGQVWVEHLQVHTCAPVLSNGRPCTTVLNYVGSGPLRWRQVHGYPAASGRVAFLSRAALHSNVNDSKFR